jgi:molybdopterin-containing oxidoreductase family iron-sulfur binding subunit
MPNAKELAAERSQGPSGGSEGPQERDANPYAVDEEDYDYRGEKRRYTTRKWAMVIDLDRCTGCHACEAACYAENNIPVVGEQQAWQGRLHQWIRVERYWEGKYPNVKARFMPIPCQQCDNAPCEPVCPVYASYHNPEGLNGMIYNRCVGTRYCGNNCPYDVRVFNWFEHLWETPLNQQLNPDVTVREKGVMEKCTFCVQRIRRAEEKADAEDRDLDPDEFTTACAEACPPKAITWGNVKDDRWGVAKLWNDPRRFRLLEELGTSPAVVYLKTVDEE